MKMSPWLLARIRSGEIASEGKTRSRPRMRSSPRWVRMSTSLEGMATEWLIVVVAEPRTRAPLGMKTTNAKARGLQTPAQLLGTDKPEKTNKRSSTQKLKKAAPPVQQSQTDVKGKAPEDDVPDIEYMPPKPQGKVVLYQIWRTLQLTRYRTT